MLPLLLSPPPFFPCEWVFLCRRRPLKYYNKERTVTTTKKYGIRQFSLRIPGQTARLVQSKIGESWTGDSLAMRFNVGPPKLGIRGGGGQEATKARSNNNKRFPLKSEPGLKPQKQPCNYPPKKDFYGKARVAKQTKEERRPSIAHTTIINCLQ